MDGVYSNRLRRIDRLAPRLTSTRKGHRCRPGILRITSSNAIMLQFIPSSLFCIGRLLGENMRKPTVLVRWNGYQRHGLHYSSLYSQLVSSSARSLLFSGLTRVKSISRCREFDRPMERRVYHRPCQRGTIDKHLPHRNEPQVRSVDLAGSCHQNSARYWSPYEYRTVASYRRRDEEESMVVDICLGSTLVD